MTGVPSQVWLSTPEVMTDADEYIESVIHRHHANLVSFDELELLFIHLTSSSNECLSIRQKGIQDLRNAYNVAGSELKLFLKEKGIELLLEESKLIWNGKSFNISYREPSLRWSDKEKAANRIGYRFEIDYSVCGFLSLGKNAYLTHVEQKPEILLKIRDLIDVDLERDWEKSHKSYEVTATVPSNNIVPRGDVLTYAMLAYHNIFNVTRQELICKRGINIPLEDIIDIKPFQGWK